MNKEQIEAKVRREIEEKSAKMKATLNAYHEAHLHVSQFSGAQFQSLATLKSVEFPYSLNSKIKLLADIILDSNS
ncbi:hypothetical protein LCGC14_1568140 [marine sediment metagenome]|uniref:Uncharacterized protein n=1 Tax=marine sediment metagenome TaxID=412755 RepID=A0A0F9LL28_9ZZZZ